MQRTKTNHNQNEDMETDEMYKTIERFSDESVKKESTIEYEMNDDEEDN